MATAYNGVHPPLVMIREDEVERLHHYASTRRRRHHLAATLLVLVFFLASAAHLVVRMSGKDRRHNREHDTSSVATAVVQPQVGASSDSLFEQDEGEQKSSLTSHGKNGAPPENQVSLDIDQTAISPGPLVDAAVSGDSAPPAAMNTTDGTSMTSHANRNETITRTHAGAANTSIPVDGKEHKAS